MISPSSLDVFELKFLQKSMILTPCGPSAVPTGGACVALPAWICNFTTACTFFAIRRLDLFYLQEVQFDRRRAAEDRDHHLQRVLVKIHIFNHAIEAGEGAFVDPHVVALLERVLRLRLLCRRLDLLEDVLDLFLAERRWL